MTTEKTTTSKNTKLTPPESESREITNKNAPKQFGLSVTLGILTILVLAASYYYGIIRF